MKCPIHNSELVSSIWNNQPIKRCKACSGVWLNDAQLKQVIRNGYDNYRKIFDLDLIARDLICPECNSTLFEVEYKNIRIDICIKCKGVWFDSGELQELCMKLKGLKIGNRSFQSKSVIRAHGNKSKQSQVSAEVAEFSIDVVLESICWLFDL